MEAPVERIMKMFHDELPRVPATGPKLRTPQDDWTKRLWSDADLKSHPSYLEPVIPWETRELPAHLRSLRRDVTRQEILTAASYLLANRRGGNIHDGDLPAPPDYVVVGSKHWSLADTFEALVLALDIFAKQESLPERVTLEEILGPIDYPMYDLREEPKYDPFKQRDEWTPRELPKEFFPDPELIRSQGIPSSGDVAGSVSVNEAYFLHAVYETARRLRDGHVPAVIPVEARLPQNRGATFEIREIKCNAAEFLYGMAEMYRIVSTEGLPRPIALSSMKIIQDQLCRYVTPSTPGWITNSFYRSGAFTWRKKVSTWLLNAAWCYTLPMR